MHQLAPVDAGELVMLGVRLGVVVAGEVESGFEFGFTIGVDEVGVVGVSVGTVVIGVVMSLWVVEICEVKYVCISSFLCPIASFPVTFIKPVLEIKIKAKAFTFSST